MRYGDKIENTAASLDNPRRTGLFVRRAWRKGRLNPGEFIEMNDGTGDFWTVPAGNVRATPTEKEPSDG